MKTSKAVLDRVNCHLDAKALGRLLLTIRAETIEACAKVCDAEKELWEAARSEDAYHVAQYCAERIRELLLPDEGNSSIKEESK